MRVILHILASLGGQIAGPFFENPATAAAAKAYAAIREELDCQAAVYGQVTMAEGFCDGLWNGQHETSLGVFEDHKALTAARTFIVSLDPQGTLFFEDGTASRKGRPPAHVIQVLTGQVSQTYLDMLRAHRVSWLWAGEKDIDLALVLEKLAKTFGLQRVLVAGGGVCDWTFVKAGLADELSLVLAPVAQADAQAPSIFEPLYPQDETTVAWQLEQAACLEGSALWLRYTRQDAPAR